MSNITQLIKDYKEYDVLGKLKHNINHCGYNQINEIYYLKHNKKHEKYIGYNNKTRGNKSGLYHVHNYFGTETEYYLNDKVEGNIICRDKCISINGNKEGKTYRHFMGKLYSIYNYSNGKPYGRQEIHYKNGNLREIYYVKDGEFYGQHEFFHKNGAIHKIFEYD